MGDGHPLRVAGPLGRVAGRAPGQLALAEGGQLASAGLGALAALLGIYLSWSLDLPAGGTIVLVSSVLFFAAWLFAPRHGVLFTRRWGVVTSRSRAVGGAR